MRDLNLKFATIYIISLLVLAFVLVAAQSILAAWTAPTAAPPGSNALLPINIGTSTLSSQAINGSLGLSASFLVNNNARVINILRTKSLTVDAGATVGTNLQATGNVVAGGNLQATGNLRTDGPSANTCKRVAYNIVAGATACPVNYYVTTISNPTPTGEMICCKVE